MTTPPTPETATARAAGPELGELVRAAAAATGMPKATVNLFDGDRQRQVGSHGFAGTDSPLADSICAQVTGDAPDVYAFTDLAEEPGFTGNPWVDGRNARVRGYASAPLVVDGSTIGTLCVFDEQPRALSLQQCDRLAELAGDVTRLVTPSA
ncbi:GAF domain-containing protein [Geodermatophilus tzadiensis]|uniref:GAF domain-containing protein n=1 Tax=Geodermatophilus tzadiensis TaxID=1137988 RepID=A0A2T0TZ94_9ACTN|nr:GAF domain-containing protein [Geodermatophilus tzadiensis]PRY50974.1 GAF domain-containing protein [Geodermatophilus tzadiensis]